MQYRSNKKGGKSPKTIYLKDEEKEALQIIAEQINKQRNEQGKSPLKISVIIHKALERGIIEIRNSYAET